MKNFTLGLDLGTNSIGWALVDYTENGKPLSLIACGSRIFQEAVDAKTKVPKNQSRRAARAARKLVKRRKMRRIKLLNLLINKNLLPKDAADREKLFNDESYDPYKLRKKALDERLELYELGRVLYHLNKRRGFQSNRKAGTKENGKINAAISSLKAEINNSKSRTLGEYLANQPKKRGWHTDRQMYEDEFNKIWKSQQRYYSTLLSSAFEVAVHKAIFFQRPLKLQKNLVGKCTLEPSRKRASRGHIEYQQFRMLQDINNLAIKNPITREYRPLRNDERKKLLELLEKQKTLSWDKARKALGLHENEVFNLEEAKKKELIGNRTASTLRSILKEQWDEMTNEKQISLVTDMLTIDNEQGFLNRMQSHWGFDLATAEKLAKTELEPGYARLSLKAIRKILPFLQQGMKYDKACLAAGYNHSNPKQQNTANQLGMPPSIRNPVVQKALYEVRKLINAIIRQYGKPQVIRLEMARDMKLTKEERENVQRNQRLREKENDEAKKILQEEFSIQNPSRDDVIKYKLWRECKMTCPYTGKTISSQMLFSPAVDIEHIIPYSRCLDDSYMNKTLCMAEENRNVKKGKTPYEAYSANESKYQEILQRVKDLPFKKRKKFEQKEVDTDEFIERQLNDTRYICRVVKNYLQQIGVNVEVSKGQATARLRRLWSLNSILADDGSLEKNRRDHRHHAIDAIVIALTTRSLFKKLADLSRQNGKALSESGFRVDHPWPTFFDDVKEKVNNIIVSHAASRKISGALHKETAYGYSKSDNCFVYRKPLSNLMETEIEKIRDQKVKQLVQERLKQFGDLKKAFGDENNPLLHVDGKTPIKSVRLKINLSPEVMYPIRNADGEPFKYFQYGNNHHVEIIENKQTGQRKAVFVTTLEAAKRARVDRQPIVNRDHGPDWRFICSLSINDMVEIEDSNEKRFYRVQKLSSGVGFEITLKEHTDGVSENNEYTLRIRSNARLNLIKRKITVDCLGYITPCND